MLLIELKEKVWFIFTEGAFKGFGFIIVTWRSAISNVILSPKIVSPTCQSSECAGSALGAPG